MTMFTKTDALEFRGMRVDVHLCDATAPPLNGVLRFVTPEQYVVLSGPDGHETRVQLDVIRSIADARTACDRCGPDSRYNNVFETREEPPRTLCADHYRGWAANQKPPIMDCPECGRPPAFFSPGDRTYACAQCHQKRAGMIGLGPEVRVMQAVCRSADIDSPDHDWKQIRGQWSCHNCHVKVRTKPAFA